MRKKIRQHLSSSGLSKKYFNSNHLFISSFPKSGGTFLFHLFEYLTGYKGIIFIKAFDRTEQDIDENKLTQNKRINTVTYQHMRASNKNLELLNAYELKPVVLTRNIFEVIASLWRHLENEPHNNWWPMAYVDEDYFTLDREKQIYFLIDAFLPWLTHFYLSWQHVAKKQNILWLDYNDLSKAKLPLILKTIAKYYSLPELNKPEEELQVALKTIHTKTRNTRHLARINFNENQVERINRFLSYYPSADFSSILGTHINC